MHRKNYIFIELNNKNTNEDILILFLGFHRKVTSLVNEIVSFIKDVPQDTLDFTNLTKCQFYFNSLYSYFKLEYESILLYFITTTFKIFYTFSKKKKFHRPLLRESRFKI